MHGQSDHDGVTGVYLQVFEYNGEGNFGELALLYNMPRAATVQVHNPIQIIFSQFPTTIFLLSCSAFCCSSFYVKLDIN